ncbi:MAG: PilZ domain-containing protein [Deltaproteobacteria bacterium]|nr:PilZ domain-containing protein [Deltaproteobacteria bacterium]
MARTDAAADRRAAPRVLLDLEVDYTAEDNFLFAYITDISATGIFVRTLAPEPPGTLLNLRFTPRPLASGPRIVLDDTALDDLALAGPGRFEVEGEVIWVNPFRPGQPESTHPGMGIRFVALSDDLRERLIDLIQRFAYLT